MRSLRILATVAVAVVLIPGCGSEPASTPAAPTDPAQPGSAAPAKPSNPRTDR